MNEEFILALDQIAEEKGISKNAILEADLQKRESDFKEKHLNLIREFNKKKRELEGEFEKKYNTKLKTSLQKDISEKFNDILQKKLDAEKVRLSKKYISELREHANDKLLAAL